MPNASTPSEPIAAAPSTSAVALSAAGPAASFEALAASIRTQAEALQANMAVRQPLSDDDWRSLSFSPPHFDMAQWAARPTLNELSGAMAVDHAYRALLGRAPDADGLASGEESLAHGLPPLLFAGILLTSPEGRSRPRPVEGFELYSFLALAYKVAVRLRNQWRIPLPWARPVLWLARLAAAFHRRWDANDLARWQLQFLRNTLASWQPVLERQAGQFGAAQKALSSFKQDLMILRSRLNALSRSGYSRELGQASLLGTDPGVSSDAKPEGKGKGQTGNQSLLSAELDAYYLAFEDVFRAQACELRKGFQAYQPVLDSLKATCQANLQSDHPPKALDLGCGRGEWLVFLTEQGFDCFGIDTNRAMVTHCQAQGLRVTECDLLQSLRGQADGSLSLLTVFHVAEHLAFATLYSLVAEAWRVLAPGGALLLETPNPENLMVGSHTFYHDPTHRNPLTPAGLGFLLRYHGYEQVDVLRLNPFPESARVAGEDQLTQRFNDLFCGAQDFAVVGHKPNHSHSPRMPSHVPSL